METKSNGQGDLEAMATAALFSARLRLYPDPSLGFACGYFESPTDKPLVTGFGTTPHKAVIDFLCKWEKG